MGTGIWANFHWENGICITGTGFWSLGMGITDRKTIELGLGLGFGKTIGWEMGFGQNLGWENGIYTPLQDPHTSNTKRSKRHLEKEVMRLTLCKNSLK